MSIADQVQSASDAIRIAKEACSSAAADIPIEQWKAEKRKNIWRVWYWPNSQRIGPTFQANVNASNGTYDGCEIQVSTD